MWLVEMVQREEGMWHGPKQQSVDVKFLVKQLQLTVPLYRLPIVATLVLLQFGTNYHRAGHGNKLHVKQTTEHTWSQYAWNVHLLPQFGLYDYLDYMAVQYGQMYGKQTSRPVHSSRQCSKTILIRQSEFWLLEPLHFIM